MSRPHGARARRRLTTFFERAEILRESETADNVWALTKKRVSSMRQPDEDSLRDDAARRRQCLRLEMAALSSELASEDQPDLCAELLLLQSEYLIEQCKNFPFHAFPIELLTLVFHHIINVPDPLEKVAATLRLTAVCKDWRSISIADKRMWCEIWFSDVGPAHHRTSMYIKRAGGLPLSVTINDTGRLLSDPASANRPEVEEASRLEMKQRIHTLKPVLHQICTLHVVSSTWTASTVVLVALQEMAIANQAMPENIRLRDLTISRQGPYSKFTEPLREEMTSELNEPIPLLNGMLIPSLNRLTLYSCHIDWNVSHFSSLTHLELRRIFPRGNGSPTVTRFREMLMSCSKLQSLHLDASTPQLDGSQGLAPAPISLPSVTSLTISNLSVNSALSTISQFDTPNVTHLNLSRFHGVHPLTGMLEDYTPLVLLLTSRRWKHVRSLTLWGFNLASPKITAADPRYLFIAILWFWSMPELKYLRLALVSDVIFEALAQDLTHVSPRLTDMMKPSTPRTTIPLARAGEVPAVDRSTWYHSSDWTSQNVPEDQRTAVLAPAVLCPKLISFEFQHLDPQIVADCCVARAAILAPVHKVFVHTPWCLDPANLTEDHKYALSNVCELYRIGLGMEPIETEPPRPPQ